MKAFRRRGRPVPPVQMRMDEFAEDEATPINGAAHEAMSDAPLEVDTQSAVLRFLRAHPRVAFAHRMNTGAGRFLYPDGKLSRFLRFGFPGMGDVLLMMKDGQYGEIEVKRQGERPTPEQVEHLALVRKHGGVGFVAYSVDDVRRELPL